MITHDGKASSPGSPNNKNKTTRIPHVRNPRIQAPIPALRSGHQLFHRPPRQKQIPSSLPQCLGLGKTDKKLCDEEQFLKSQPKLYERTNIT